MKWLILALLLVGRGYGLEYLSPAWKKAHEESWARAVKIAPDAGKKGTAFLKRMGEFDQWAKEHKRSLFEDPNKPVLLALMVQKELQKAAPTAAPKVERKPQYGRRRGERLEVDGGGQFTVRGNDLIPLGKAKPSHRRIGAYWEPLDGGERIMELR